MISRPWHIVRWFGFLAIGLTIAIGSGMRFRAQDQAGEAFPELRESPGDSTVAQSPRSWLAPEPHAGSSLEGLANPPALPEPPGASNLAISKPAEMTLDPNSPQAEQEIDAIVAAMSDFDVANVQVRTIEDRGRRRFIFSCDVPTGDGAASFVGEGPDPPSAARHALSRIRSWAAAPGASTLR